MSQNNFGLIGLGVMGENLVLNIESRGYSVSVYNRTTSKMTNFISGKAKGKNIEGFEKLEDFVQSLEKPRKIMLMVKAGKPVDATIDSLIPLLDKDDIIIDGGNSFFKDTIRRNQYLKEKGLRFIGTGVSGGEEGALKGPSIMPGGDLEAYKEIEPIFTKISAKADDGAACVTHIGPDGAGHYVKMVHNGIEYGDMQLISEAYYLMKNVLGLSNEEMSNIFSEWNKGVLNSYLIEITADILKKKDEETGKYVIDIILDRAGQKGTGKWTGQSALDLGISLSTITEAVFARCISAVKKERTAASKVLTGPEVNFTGSKEEFIQNIHDALYASKICSYAQGFALMREAGKEYNWDLDFGKISMIWRGGCIIRAQFLERIKEAYDRKPDLANLLLDEYFKEAVEKGQTGWRNVIIESVKNGIPALALTSSLAYYDSYRTERLSANMIQAQRDYFGAHTYERVDKEGIFHTQWI